MAKFDYLHSEKIYFPGDEDLLKEQFGYIDKLYDYNATRPYEGEKRAQLLREMLAEVGENCYIEPPLHANWAGRFVHLGKSVYANFNLTLVDDTRIDIGDHTMLGPNVTIATAGHPVDPELRERVAQFNLPVRIGRNCWLGAGVIVLPGVTIGDNSVIGAGSVVTRDIPPMSFAAGVPCKVIRPITEADSMVNKPEILGDNKVIKK